MQSLFGKQAYDEITARLHKLSPQTQRQWGKMDVAQMLAHTCEPVKMIIEHKKRPRTFMGYLFGSMAKKMATNDQPYKRSVPTDKSFIITDQRNFDKEKQNLLDLLSRFYQAGEKGVTPYPHPFFGKMTPREWGYPQYKHLDHHLKQFGV